MVRAILKIAIGAQEAFPNIMRVRHEEVSNEGLPSCHVLGPVQ